MVYLVDHLVLFSSNNFLTLLLYLQNVLLSCYAEHQQDFSKTHVTTKNPPSISKSTLSAFARNQCSTSSAVREPMSLLSSNMKFLVSCSHHCASKIPSAFIDFLLAPWKCVSCSCFGEIGSLFIVFIHFISTTVLTEGLWNWSHSHRNDLLRADMNVREGQGTGGLVHGFVDGMNSRRCGNEI